MPISNARWLRAEVRDWKNPAIVGLYALGGLVDSLLPLGQQAPFWPGIGLGVAALLLGGPGCWPGVWLGSLLSQLWRDPSLSSAIPDLLLACSETALAWLAAWLGRRYLSATSGGPHPDGHNIDSQYDRFFSLAPNLLCIVGCDGRFQRINATFSRTLGWNEQELLGRSFLEFIHPDDLRSTLTVFEKAKKGKPIIDFESRYLCREGSWRWLNWMTFPQPDGTWFASARDTTEQHLAAHQLRELNAQLEQRIGKHRQALAELEGKKEEIRAVLDHLLDCVITLDRRGTIQSVSAAIEPLLGYSPEELVGRNMSCLVASSFRERRRDLTTWELDADERRIIGSRLEVTGQHRDGREIALELSASEYQVHGERFLIASLRDIRERKALIAKLTQAREDAEQANRAKSTFLAAMSHEIRTPMNGVIGLIDVLAQDDLSAHQTDLVQTIRESSGNLLVIINDILDFSKIEAGKLAIERAPLNLAELLDGLCGSLLALARSHRVELSQIIAADVPRWVRSDATRLRQILYNLIGNALKFSGGRGDRSGHVVVRVRLAASAPLRVAFSVEDDGIGIVPEDLPGLFMPFSQGSFGGTRRFGGTGLGLAICKRLVHLLHGEIEVSSTPGRGSAFTVTLPFETAEAPTRGDDPTTVATATTRRNPSADTPPKILVAEDDPVNRKVIQQQLALLGYAYDMAGDGTEALDLWRRSDYDLVLSDLQMPGIDGYSLTTSIRREEAGQRHTPILALSANALHSEAERALNVGMDEYLTKPIRLDTLGEALARWLGRESRPLSPPAAGTAETESAQLVELTALHAQLGEDAPLVREIVAVYLQSLCHQAQALQEAFGRGDSAAVGHLAHSLKSASLSVGAMQLGRLCAELEQAAGCGDTAGLGRGITALAPLARATAARISQWLRENTGAMQD